MSNTNHGANSAHESLMRPGHKRDSRNVSGQRRSHGVAKVPTGRLLGPLGFSSEEGASSLIFGVRASCRLGARSAKLANRHARLQFTPFCDPIAAASSTRAN